MSHSGWSGSNYVSALAAVPSGLPLSMHCRYNPSSVSASLRFLGIAYADSSNYYALLASTAQPAGRVIGAGSNSTFTGPTTTMVTGTWYAIGAKWVSTTSRTCYVDGVAGTAATTSRTASSPSLGRIGVDNTAGSPAAGSIAEFAMWSVALSDEDFAALVYTSPLLIRPGALVSYIPLLDSGTLDLVAPAATVTGTLTKDNDHPRVILPRQRSLIIPKSAGGGGGIEGVVAQTLSAFTQSSTGKLAIKANGNKTLSAFTQTSTGSGGRRGDVTQTLGAVAQTTATGRVRIKGQV